MPHKYDPNCLQCDGGGIVLNHGTRYYQPCDCDVVEPHYYDGLIDTFSPASPDWEPTALNLQSGSNEHDLRTDWPHPLF